MAEVTTISWTDHSASPWYGCAEVHAGCDNCYARELAKRNPATLGVWGPDGTRVKSKSFIRNLQQWNKQAAAEGRIASVFPSLCDPFEDRPELVPWRNEMFRVADECPNIRLLLLTKRPENVRKMWPEKRFDGAGWNGTLAGYWHDREKKNYRSNCWLLASISDQPTADAMIPPLLECRDLVSVLGVSAEPLVGPIEFSDVTNRSDAVRQLGKKALDGIRWVIIGGESGPRARPCNLAWARSLLDQCREANVAAYFKQAGARPYLDGAVRVNAAHQGSGTHREQTPLKLRDPKGGDLSELPAWCHVRQFPSAEGGAV